MIEGEQGNCRRCMHQRKSCSLSGAEFPDPPYVSSEDLPKGMRDRDVKALHALVTRLGLSAATVGRSSPLRKGGKRRNSAQSPPASAMAPPSSSLRPRKRTWSFRRDRRVPSADLPFLSPGSKPAASESSSVRGVVATSSRGSRAPLRRVASALPAVSGDISADLLELEELTKVGDRPSLDTVRERLELYLAAIEKRAIGLDDFVEREPYATRRARLRARALLQAAPSASTIPPAEPLPSHDDMVDALVSMRERAKAELRVVRGQIDWINWQLNMLLGVENESKAPAFGDTEPYATDRSDTNPWEAESDGSEYKGKGKGKAKATAKGKKL